MESRGGKEIESEGGFKSNGGISSGESEEEGGTDFLCDRIKLSTASKNESGTKSEGGMDASDKPREVRSPSAKVARDVGVPCSEESKEEPFESLCGQVFLKCPTERQPLHLKGTCR